MLLSDRCLHIYTVLGERETYERYYRKQRWLSDLCILESFRSHIVVFSTYCNVSNQGATINPHPYPAKLHARRHWRLQTGMSFYPYSPSRTILCAHLLKQPEPTGIVDVFSSSTFTGSWASLCVKITYWILEVALFPKVTWRRYVSMVLRFDSCNLQHLQVWGGATAKIVATLRTHSAYCTNASLMLKIKNLIMLFAR